MDRHAQKVFLAVALGIGLGILAGRAIGGPIAWLLGALIGGASAYVLFAPIAAIRAIPAAYRAARGKWPSAERWEEVRWTFWAILAPYTSMLAVFFLIAWCDKDTTMSSTPLGWLVLGSVAAIAALPVGVIVVLLHDVAHLVECERMWVRRRIAMNTLLPVLLFWHLPRALWWIAVVAVPEIVRFSLRLGKQWLIVVHSDLRTLCLADAFLFAGIGTLTGGPILAWMVGGGAFGVLNYKVVSLRILKLRPVRPAE